MKLEVIVWVKNPIADTDEDAPEELQYRVIITSWGAPATWTSYGGDPAEPPEWEITKIYDEEGKEIMPENHRYKDLLALVDKHMEEDFDWPDAESYDPDLD
jgi:hypothetical protein